MSKVLTAVVVIGAGAGFFGWYDLFHLTIGLLLLVAGTLLLQWWQKRTQLEEEEEEVEEEEGLGHQVFVGALGGLVSLLLLTGASSVASHTPLYGWFYDRDCPDLLKEIDILEEGEAHARIVQIVDERLQHKISSTCRKELKEKKVCALIAWAEQVNGEAWVSKLQQARQEAEDLSLIHI